MEEMKERKSGKVKAFHHHGSLALLIITRKKKIN
jgi:hypothetical protein